MFAIQNLGLSRNRAFLPKDLSITMMFCTLHKFIVVKERQLKSDLQKNILYSKLEVTCRYHHDNNTVATELSGSTILKPEIGYDS